ncbi:hypothetical protein ACKGJI_01675 [Sulfurospirillum sp. 1307]
MSSPLKVGIYKDNELIKEYSSEKQTSEVLPQIFKQILEEYECKRLFFARGPGSFMAIKVSFIFLRTISISKNIELFATDGFYFNNNMPIKAMRKLFFVKNNDKIETQVLNDAKECEFHLPKVLHIEDFSKEIEPLYILPAV